MIYRLFVFLTIIIIDTAVAQQQSFILNYDKTDSESVLNDLEKKTFHAFSYASDLIKNKTFSCKKATYTFDEILTMISDQWKVKFLKITDYYYVIVPANLEKWKQQSLQEIIVKAYLTQGIGKYKDGSFRINLKNMGILPGLIEPDVLESVQQLPGVISLNETATNFSIRGGKTDQNAIYWEGIPLYQNGHLFGMISPFNPYIVDKVTYYYKGTPARYEGGASGIINLNISNKINKKTQIEAGINGLAGDVILKTSLPNKKWGLILSARSSYRDIWPSPSFKSLEEKVIYNTNIVNKNTAIQQLGFQDYSLKLMFKPNIKNSYSASLLHIHSDLDFKNTVNNLPDYYYINDLGTTTNGLSISAKNILHKKLILNSRFIFSQYDLTFADSSYKQNILSGYIYKENFVSDIRVETIADYQINTRHAIQAGYQINEKRSAYLFKVVINNKVYIFDYLRTKLHTYSIFSRWRYRNNGWHIHAGSRLQYLNEINKWYLEPRMVVSKNIFKNIEAQITGEIKHQNIQQYNKTVIGLLNLENKIWHVSQEKDFPVVEEKQVSSGLIYKHRNWIAEIDFYLKNLDRITFTVPYRIYNRYEHLIGKEYIKGMDIFVKKDFNHFQSWLSFGLMKADYQFKDLKDNKRFTSDLEIGKRFSSSLIYKYKQIKLAMGWYWHSPQVYYQNIINPEASERDDNFKKNFHIKSLSNYHRFDLSVLYQLKLSNNKPYRLRMGVSVRNIFDVKNKISKEINSHTLDTSLQSFERYGLGRTINFSLRIYYR